MHWYIYALLAFFIIGIQRFFYNVAAKYNCNSLATTLIFMFSVSCISFIYIFATNTKISLNSYTLFLSFLNSITFSIATISHIQALKFSSPSLVYPFIRLNILIVVLYSCFILMERLTSIQLTGIFISIIALFLISSEFKNDSYKKKENKIGFIWASFAMVCGAISSISCKYAANYINKFVFIFISYVMSTFFLTIGLKLLNPKENLLSKKHYFKFATIIIGILMGILNILGFYCYLMALETGPLSIVVTINGMHFVIGIIMSAIIFKDKITKKSLYGIFLTIISLILLTNF